MPTPSTDVPKWILLLFFFGGFVFSSATARGQSSQVRQDTLHQYLSRTLNSNHIKGIASSSPVKCLTPFIKQYRRNRDQFSAETRQQIDRLLRERQSLSGSPDSLLSPSGKFEVHYSTTGTDSIPATDADNNGTPDYAEWAAAYADSSWRHEVRNLGYPDPLTRQESPYEIYLVETQFYGSTFEKGDGDGTYFEVHRNFNGFPENTDPEGNRKGALKATIAHELKHAINYFITNWQGEVDRWTEMDATLMEDLVFDPVNDYYNYLNSMFSIFSRPEISLYPGSYEHVSFPLYFTDQFDATFWTRVWEFIEKGYQDGNRAEMIPAIDSTLREYSSADFDRHFTNNHLWHFATGPSRVAVNFGFRDRLEQFKGKYAYPASRLTHTHDSTGVPDTLSGWRNISNLAAHHISITPQSGDHGPVQVSVQYDSSRIGVGLIAYSSNRVQTHIKTGQRQDSLLLTPDWWWSDIDRLGIVVANPDANHFGLPYRIRYGTLDRPIVDLDLPERNELYPNYPNPFNQSTTISLFLTHMQDVDIRIYDVTGRLIRTIRRNRMLPGYRTVPFDAGNLSSGLYLYRVITETRAMTGKMMLVK